MIRIDINRRNRVDASASIDLSLSASVVWGQMRDIAHFLTIDPLHFRVRSDHKNSQGDKASANDCQHIPSHPVGTGLVIQHRFLGLGPDRRSRILRWREGEGYAVSDLSRRGNHCGFPHVCVYEINATSETTSRLLVSTRGKWTATWMPRWTIRLWLWWVLKSTAAHITSYFELYELKMRRRRIRSRQPPPPRCSSDSANNSSLQDQREARRCNRDNLRDQFTQSQPTSSGNSSHAITHQPP